ncbi:MAG: helix-hairpin-helix domain-containing protein [Desulfobacterales bacterium]
MIIHTNKNYPVLLYVLLFFFLFNAYGYCKDAKQIDLRFLSDDAFAAIETNKKGEKIRHCPHHDSEGKLDNEQVIYMLGVFDKETWIDIKNREAAKKHLEKHYDKFKSEMMKKELKEPLNINNAKLTELVMLPNIGPVVAVKIVEYRKAHMRFKDIDEIKKVEGIGQGTFNGIRHYIMAGNP